MIEIKETRDDQDLVVEENRKKVYSDWSHKEEKRYHGGKSKKIGAKKGKMR